MGIKRQTVQGIRQVTGKMMMSRTDKSEEGPILRETNEFVLSVRC